MFSFKLLAVLALAATAHAGWEIIAKEILTIDFGIGFRSETEGFIAGAQNGPGNEVLKTENGGMNWTLTNTTNLNDALIIMGMAVGKKSVVVAGVFGMLYSLDEGNDWHLSVGGMHTMCVRPIGQGVYGDRYAAVGTFNGQQVVAISNDGGKLFTQHSSDVFYTFARYGAFPDPDNVWYIAAGSTPQTQDDDFNKDDDDGFNVGNTTGTYEAQLVKYDHGTWTTQLTLPNGTAVFNGIDCTSTEHCCVTTEGPYSGGIWCTFDGKTWNQTYNAQGTSNEVPTINDVRFASATLGWAVGAKLGASFPTAIFLETTDGGKTWREAHEELAGNIAVSIDTVDENMAYATVINPILSFSSVAKWTP